MKNLFKKYGIELNDRQLEQFEIYFDFLISENKKYNLTAITERDEVYVKHFLDSLIISKYFDLSDIFITPLP